MPANVLWIVTDDHVRSTLLGARRLVFDPHQLASLGNADGTDLREVTGGLRGVGRPRTARLGGLSRVATW